LTVDSSIVFAAGLSTGKFSECVFVLLVFEASQFISPERETYFFLDILALDSGDYPPHPGSKAK